MLILGHYRNQGARIYIPGNPTETDVVFREIDYRNGSIKAQCDIYQDGQEDKISLEKGEDTLVNETLTLAFREINSGGQARIMYLTPPEFSLERWQYAFRGKRRLRKLTKKE